MSHAEDAAVLPVRAILPELKECLGRHRSAVLIAPPGAGKTTLVPPALLDAPWLAGRSIVMLEPRRLAAKAAAARMAGLLGEPVGETVGYRIRLESRVSRRTRIEVVTEGILARRLMEDPSLEGVGLVIFDEFHERHLDADLSMALCLEARSVLREDLRLLAMSATLEGERVSALLCGAPILRSDGRQYPVEIHHAPRDSDSRERIETVVAGKVLEVLRQESGDVLVFLAGQSEIRRTMELLSGDLLPGRVGPEVEVHGLYGDLPFEAQERAIRPAASGRRKIVLATNIAETSLTIEGVHVVVDSGWHRAPRFDPGSGLTRLATARISRASADQRAGRAGRLGPGSCHRLYSEGTYAALLSATPPEIRNADLAPLALSLAAWGVRQASSLAWLDPPPEGAMAQARDLLARLGALDELGGVTPFGRSMAALPVHPRLAHMLLLARDAGEGAVACDLAALVSERDVLGIGRSTADLEPRLRALEAFRAAGRTGAAHSGANPERCARVIEVSRQFARLLDLCNSNDPVRLHRAGQWLAAAWPDRVALRRSGSASRYQLASGRGALLAEDDPLGSEPMVVAAVLDGSGTESKIRLAIRLDPAALESGAAGPIEERRVVAWSDRERAVVARRERRLGALVLAEEPLRELDPEAVKAALIEGIRRLGISCLPWTDATQSLRARMASMRAWFPDESWPDVTDAALIAGLADWLGPWIEGVQRVQALAALDLRQVLASRLGYVEAKRLDEGAPLRLPVPSGSQIALEYSMTGASPTLSVKIQELFGLAETPHVAFGRVPVTLHLLSPARRPIQITQDLRGFWDRTWPEVRKELKGRYPKHPWPEDPWNAVPTARARPRA